MKISSSIYDQNHMKELERHTQAFNKSIHLISRKNRSINKFENVTEELLLVDDNNLIKTLNSIQGSFDLVVITDLFELTDDIYSVFKSIANILNPDGKLLVNSVNPKWNAVLKIFEKLQLKTASQDRAYIHPKKIINIAKSDGYELNQYYSRQLFPFRIFGLGKIVNKILEVILLPFNVGIKNYMVFGSYKIENQIKSKSIIIPAKNEEKNLIPLIKRIPHFNEEYELVVVYGDSKDKTEEVVLNLENVFPELNIKVLKQSSNGKANAVWEAVEVCDMELIAILDSDQSVDPETLEHFFEILENGNADFVNGTRLIYPMEDKAMRTINTLGNKIFQFLISLVIKQKLTDSLCGTKVFKKSSVKKLNTGKTLCHPKTRLVILI